jgi:hypothetical protein
VRAASDWLDGSRRQTIGFTRLGVTDDRVRAELTAVGVQPTRSAGHRGVAAMAEQPAT